MGLLIKINGTKRKMSSSRRVCEKGGKRSIDMRIYAYRRGGGEGTEEGRECMNMRAFLRKPVICARFNEKSKSNNNNEALESSGVDQNIGASILGVCGCGNCFWEPHVATWI